MLGETIDGKYRVVRLIGAGGMGSVYEAVEVGGRGLTVAVKVLNFAGLDTRKSAAAITRFQREARAAGSIDTEHIARVLDAGTDPASGQPFMVMEYLLGEDAQCTFQRLGPIASDVALRITAQACVGIEKAHAAGVVHRDIKPANLFLARAMGERIVVKLLDFGVAKIDVEHSGTTPQHALTRTGSMLGSPLYMAPEQARGAKVVDHRADIWALGIALYQALAGRTPHQHIDAFGELIIAICSSAPPPVQRFAPWVSPEVAAIVDRALRIDAGERYQTATEMLDAMRPYLADGFEVTEPMLVSVDDDVRARRAPRYSRELLGDTAVAEPEVGDELVITRPLGSSDEVSEEAEELELPLAPSRPVAAVDFLASGRVLAVPPPMFTRALPPDLVPPPSQHADAAGAPTSRSNGAWTGRAPHTDPPPVAVRVRRVPAGAQREVERLPLREQLRQPLRVILVALLILVLEWSLRPLFATTTAAATAAIVAQALWVPKALMVGGVVWAFFRVFIRPLSSDADGNV